MRKMSGGMIFLVLVTVGGEVCAQPVALGSEPSDRSPTARCHSVSPIEEVVVTTASDGSVRGTLMCMSDAKLWLVRDGQMSAITLDQIHRIRTPADPVWDGALKGAVIPLIVWAVLCHDCRADPFLRMSLTYGAIGLVTDAIDTNRRTLYRGPRRSLRVGWGFSF